MLLSCAPISALPSNRSTKIRPSSKTEPDPTGSPTLRGTLLFCFVDGVLVCWLSTLYREKPWYSYIRWKLRTYCARIKKIGNFRERTSLLWLLSILSNAINRSNNRESSSRAQLFLNHYLYYKYQGKTKYQMLKGIVQEKMKIDNWFELTKCYLIR